MKTNFVKILFVKKSLATQVGRKLISAQKREFINGSQTTPGSGEQGLWGLTGRLRPQFWDVWHINKTLLSYNVGTEVPNFAGRVFK